MGVEREREREREGKCSIDCYADDGDCLVDEEKQTKKTQFASNIGASFVLFSSFIE